MKFGFVFPGQGSQYVGMGRAWTEQFSAAREVFEEADEVLGFPLSRLCWEGPEEELTLTVNTQPAILATSVAILRVLQKEGAVPAVVAGHSLGEYSALVAAETLQFGDALQLVRARGELMQKAVPVGVGAMAAILGLDRVAVNEIVETSGDDEQECTVANFNSPQQTVIAGHTEAVEAAMEEARHRGARRAVRLPVSAPFHSPLMRPARQGLEPLLRDVPFADPRMPVVTNIDATAIETGEAARDALVRQVDGPVRWVESIRSVVDDLGIKLLIEVGPGRVLCGLVKRIDAEIEARSCAEPEDLDGVRAVIGD
jgi:[acyl-carrier-protein] S-malonyltransferase